MTEAKIIELTAVRELDADELLTVSAGKNDDKPITLKFDVPGESTGGSADRWIEGF